METEPDISETISYESPDIQNDEEATLDVLDGAKDKLGRSSVTLAKHRASQQESGPEVGEKIKEASSTVCEEKKQDATELNKQGKDVTSVGGEMQNKNSLNAPFITEETSLQEVDNSEIFEVDPKIGLGNIVIESTKEVMNRNEIFEKFSQADSSASENDKDIEKCDKNPDASSVTCEEGTQSNLDVTEASAGEKRDKEGFTVVVPDDNISKTELNVAIKLSTLESKEHEGGPEHLQPNEPEKEELERTLNKISEEIETGASRENAQFENPEDSFKEKRKDDKSTATYDTNRDEFPGQKNPPPIDSNEKTDSSEVEIPNSNANNLQVTHSLVEETGQVEGKRIDEVSNFEPEEEIQKSNGASLDEENQVANASEAYKSTEELETVYGLESDEKLEVRDAEANKPEVTKMEEAIVTDIHKIAKSNDIEEGLLEDDRTKVYHTVYTGDKTVEQSFQVESLREAAPTLSSENERSNIKLEEVHDGHTIPGSGDVNKEQVLEANVTFFTPEPIEKETTKNYQDSEKETKMSREEDGGLEIMKEGKELSTEFIEEGPIQNFEDNKKEAKESKDEIFEKPQPAREGESIAHETKHDESLEKILDTSLVKQEEGLQGEVEHLVSTEASEENGDKDISSVEVAEDNNDNNRLAEAKENSAKVTPQGEDDLEEGLQIDETGERIIVKSPENILVTSLVKQKEDMQGEGEKLKTTEASIKNKDEEASSIKMAEDNDENNKTSETTENSVKVTPKGEEDPEHALQNDELGETNQKVESPGEVLDTQLVKPGIGLQGDSRNLAPAENSMEKRDEGISSVKVAADNDRLAEATENSAKATPEGEENSEHILQKDEPGESITQETNNGAEIPENISNPPLVKQEEGPQGESENVAPTEAAMEKRDEDTSYVEVAEENDDNNRLAEDTENSEKVTPEGGEDSENVLQIDEPGQNIVGVANHNVDSPENNLDTLFVKQEESLEGEGENSTPTKTSIENSDEDIFSVKVAEDNDENNRLAEIMENSEEDSEQVLQKDDPREKNHDVESPDNTLDNSLLIQEEDLHVEGEDLAPTETSIKNKDEDTPPVIAAEHKDDNNRQDETRENNAKGTTKGEEDSEHVVQKDAVEESIACETDHEDEKHEKALNTPLVKQEGCLQGQDENMIATEASTETRDEETSMKIAEGNDDINRVAEAAGNSVKGKGKGEEDTEQVFQKNEPGEKLEQLLDVTPDEMEAESSSEEAKKTTCIKEEGIIQNLEETSETEKREEEAAREKVFNTTSVGEVNREQILEEIDSVKDQSPEFNENETTKENSKDDQESRGLETTASSIETEKPNLEKQDIAELSSSSVGEVIVKESLKEDESDAMKLKEEVKGQNLEFTEQIGEKDLTEESNLGTLQDSEEPNKNFSTLTTAENSSFVPEASDKEIKEEILKQEEHSNNDFDSTSVTVLSEETGFKETKPENNEQVKSSDVAPEGKGLTTIEKEETSLDNVDIDVQPEEISGLEENRNKEILTVADGSGEKNENQVEDKVPTKGISHEVELTTAETPLDGISEDSSQDSYIMPLKDHDPMKTGVRKIVEETPISDEITNENFKTTSSVKKTDEELLQIEDESIKSKDVSELLSSDDGKEDANEEFQKHKDPKSHVPPELHDKKNSYDTEDVELSENRETSDLADQTEVFNTTSVNEGNKEQILEEIDSVKDQSPEFNEKETTKENSKDDQESRGLETTASSIETEKPNLEKPAIAELPSSSIGEVTVKESLKEDESNATKLKEEIKGPNLEFIEQIEAKDVTEESKSGTLEDSANPNKNFSTLTTAENSSFVPEVSEKEIKEEILEQEDHTNNDFYSASDTVLGEETGLKETKPENNEQVKSSAIAPEGEGLVTTEIEGTNLDNIDTDVQPEEISSLEENRNKEILTVADGGGEKIEHQMEDKASTKGISHEVEVINVERPLDSISKDCSREFYIMPLEDHEPMTIGVSKTVEEAPARDEITDANAKTPSSLQETDEKLIQKEDESLKAKDVSELFSSDDGKEDANEEVQKHKDAESRMPPKLHNEKNSYDREDVEISKREETSDLVDQTEVFNTTSVGEVNREQIIEEIDIVMDQSPEFNEKETTKESSKDDQESRGLETTTSSIETEKPNLEKLAIAELSPSSVGEVTVKESLKEDESDATKLKEEVEGPTLEFIEKIGAKDLSEESKSGTLQDNAEPNKNFSTLTTAENSSLVPEVSEKEIKEEIPKQEEHTNNDFDSASVIVLSEETGLKEAKPGNNEQVKSSDIAPEGKGLATIETEETNLDNVDIDVQPEEISSLEENRNKEILTVADGGGNKIELQMDDKAPTGGIGHEVPLDSISEDSSRDSYIMPLKDHEPMNIGVSKIVEETPARGEIIDENAKTVSGQKTDEELIQKEDESIKSKDVCELFSSDDGNEDANEEVQKHKDAESHMPLELHNQKNSHDTEDVEISKRGETSDLVDQIEVCKLGTLTDEAPSKEASKSIADSEKATLEQEDSVQNFEGSVKGVAVEKGTAESNAGAHSHECEATNTENEELIAEKNLESADLGQKPDLVSESVNKDQSDETLPQTNKSQTEEKRNENQDWNSESVEQKNIGQIEGETERKLEMEPKLEAEDHIHVLKNANDTITAVITTEKVHEGIEKVDGSENIRERVIDGDSDVKEIHTVSTGDEIVEKEKDYGLESTECLKATDSKEQTETLKTNIEEDPILVIEAPNEVSLKPIEEHEGVEKVNESEKIIEQAEDRKSDFKESNTISARDEILEEVNDCGPESTESFKPTDSKEQIETVNTNIKEDPIWETEAPITKAPKEEKKQDEDSLKPADVHEGVDKIDESKNIRQEATDGESDFKQIHTVFVGDEILENMTDSGPKSTDYLKAIAFKEQTNIVNMEIKEETPGESEALVTRTPEEYSIKPAEVHEEVEKVNESKNIIEQAKDGESGLKKIHRRSAGNEILEKMNDSGPESTEYLKATDSKEQIGIANANIEEDPTGETKAPEEEEMQYEGTLKTVDVQEGVEKVDESANIRQQATDGESSLNKIQTSAGDEILENIKDSGSESSKYFKATDSQEHTETENMDIKADPTGETEVPVTKAPKEEIIPDESGLEPASVHKGVEKVDDSESTREQAIEGESNLKEIHTIFTKDEILEKEKDYNLESTEYLKATGSKEQTETVKTNIEEDPARETKVLVTEAPNEDSLKPIEEHEGVEKVNECENIIKQAEDRKSDFKESNTISAIDEILEEVNDCGPESTESFKPTDSKEQIETVNTDIKEDPIRETEAPVTKAPKEEKIQDEDSLKPADVHEGVDKIDESENIRQEATDGESFFKEIHTASVGDEIIENVTDSSPKSTEYLKATDSKVPTKIVNMEIKEETTEETEALVTKTPEEDSIKPAKVHEEVENVNAGKNMLEHAKDGQSDLKEIHTRSAGNEILDKMNDSGPESTEYLKATDCEEQIGTANTNIEDLGETELPVTKAPEEEEMQYEGTLKTADVQEGVEIVDESDNIRQQATDGESDLKKIQTISAKDEILEKVKDSGSESSEYFKARDSKEHTETENTDIKEDPTGETEVPVTEAPKEEIIPDEGSLKLAEVNEEVEKVNESENIIEQAKYGVSDLKETHKISIGDEILEKVNDSGPESIEYLKETDSKEQIEMVNTDVEKDPSGETEALVITVPEEKIQDEGSLKPVDVHEEIEQVDESENIIQQATDGDHNMEEIHTVSIGDELLKNVKNSGPKCTEYFTVKDSNDQKEIVNTDSKEDPTREIEASLTKAPKEDKIQDEGSLNPTDGHEEVEKVDRSENINEHAIDGERNLKEIHTASVGEEILEKVKDSDLKSTGYLKATDSKEQTETVNTDIEEGSIRELEAPITKAPEEEEIQDEDSLKPASVHERFEKANGSENIEQAIDGKSNLREVHTIPIGDEILQKVKDFGPESTEYLKATKSKPEIETVNTNIEEDPIGETEATVTKAQEEEKIQDEGILKEIDGHKGVEKAAGSENNREQAIDGESNLKEIHTVSCGDDILNKVKVSSPESTEYLKETDTKEHTETVNTNIKEDPIDETELPVPQAQEDEGSVKPTNVSMTVAEDAKEKIKEEIDVEVDNFPHNADNAIAVPAESSSEEAQMDDKAVKDTSSDESLEIIKTESCQQAEEVDSMKPEKASFNLVSKLPNMDHKNVETETVTLEKPDADEVEETKIVSEAVFQSKYHGVEETDKTKQSLRAEKLDADETEEGIKEASGTVSESKSLGIEAVIREEITADQTLPAWKLEEQLQKSSSEFLFWEHDHGPTNIVKETETIKTKEGETTDDKNINDSSATKATEETCLQKEEQLQTLSSTFLSREQEQGTTTTFKKTEEESIKEVEMLDEKGINNSSAIKATEETCLEHEESEELKVSKLELEINNEGDNSNKLCKEEYCNLDGASKLETTEKEDCEKIKELTRPIEDASNLSFEKSEKAFESMLDVHSREALVNSEEKIQDEGIVKAESVSITVAEELFENSKDEIKVEVDNSYDKTENAIAEVVTKEPSSVEAQLHDKSTEDTSSDDKSETITMESSPPAEEDASMKLEKSSSNLLSQLLNIAIKNEEKESTLENPDANEVEETKTASDAVFDSKYQSVKETDETGESLTVEKLDASDIEKTKETSEISSKSKALGLEAVSEDEVIADQTLPAEILGGQLQPSSPFLSMEQEHGTTITAKRAEEENIKKVNTVGDEVRKEEGSTLDQALKVQPHEKEEIKYANSPLESEEIMEQPRPIPVNLNFEKIEKACDYVSEVQSHEVLTKSEDTNEKHLQAAITDLNNDESESQCKKTVEANKMLKNEVPIEEVTEEKEVHKDSKSVSLGEETIIESHQGHESKLEEHPGEETNKTFIATTDADQNEAPRLSEKIDKGSTSEDIENKITVEDRAVENENAAESYPDEAEGKNVEEAAIKLDLENQSGDKNITKGTTEVMTLGEKEAVEISPKEGTMSFSEIKEITQNIQQLEKTSYAASKKKIPGEAGPSRNTGTIITTGHEGVQPVLQNPIDEVLQKVELEDTRPGKATEADAYVRGVECEGEKRMGDSGEQITEESTSVDSAKISLSNLTQRSKKENRQVTKEMTKEKEPMPTKEEMQNQEAETTIDEAKTDVEEGDEHKRTDPGSDAPVMVEAPKDIDVKVVHKKSHNILSGVSSKVKHSISKVKKAIIGKSSHPKTTSPK